MEPPSPRPSVARKTLRSPRKSVIPDVAPPDSPSRRATLTPTASRRLSMIPRVKPDKECVQVVIRCRPTAEGSTALKFLSKNVLQIENTHQEVKGFTFDHIFEKE